MKITSHQFFTDFFPFAYLCATSETGAQFGGEIPDLDPDFNEKTWPQAIKRFQIINSQYHNIFFTPNGALTVDGKNSLTNLRQVNSWWTDIDIEISKKAGNDPETLALRQIKKEEILTYLYDKFVGTPKIPSLVVETRNGFQLYWFSDGLTPENSKNSWKDIAESIYQEFKSFGADHAVVKIMQLMRVPNFYYFKNDEQGRINIVEALSSYRYHSDQDMVTYFPPVSISNDIDSHIFKEKIYKPQVVWDPDHKNDIFVKVTNLPIDDVLSKLSGTKLVSGDTIEIQKLNSDKSNLIINGKMSPNWVVRSENHIYSNNAVIQGPTIIEFISWYGWNKSEIAEGLKELF